MSKSEELIRQYEDLQAAYSERRLVLENNAGAVPDYVAALKDLNVWYNERAKQLSETAYKHGIYLEDRFDPGPSVDSWIY